MNPIRESIDRLQAVRRRMQDADGLGTYANYAEQYVDETVVLVGLLAVVTPGLFAGDDLDPAMLAKLGEN